MASGTLETGLSASILDDLRRVFAAFPEIERVLIIGSRANGTFKDDSDIDLAVLGAMMSDTLGITTSRVVSPKKLFSITSNQTGAGKTGDIVRY